MYDDVTLQITFSNQSKDNQSQAKTSNNTFNLKFTQQVFKKLFGSDLYIMTTCSICLTSPPKQSQKHNLPMYDDETLQIIACDQSKWQSNPNKNITSLHYNRTGVHTRNHF